MPADPGITKSHPRPWVFNDNPYSESQDSQATSPAHRQTGQCDLRCPALPRPEVFCAGLQLDCRLFNRPASGIACQAKTPGATLILESDFAIS